MPIDSFICPDGVTIKTEDCLSKCRMSQRCISKATLRTISRGNAKRKWDGVPHVTQLLNGTMLSYLEVMNGYPTDPMDSAYTLLGSNHHALLESGLEPEEGLTEYSINNGWIQGTVDSIERTPEGWLITDYKTFGSYRVAKLLGIVRVKGLKRGSKPMFTQSPSSVDNIHEALQLNMYRLLVKEELGHSAKLRLQVTVRDGGLQVAASRGIDKPLYLVDVPTLPDDYVRDYFKSKAEALVQEVKGEITPAMCTSEEDWEFKRCARYCSVAHLCNVGKAVKLGIREGIQ